jgi:UDP-N-acetylmuramoylalanine--D-glutamate ligase
MDQINSNKIGEIKNPFLAARENQLKNISEHSMEIVGVFNKIVYINDSKSTTSAATRESIESLKQPFILITGGDDSETLYNDYNGMDLQYLKAVFYLGPKLGRIVKQFLKQDIIFVAVKKIDEAIALSAIHATENEAILFSPACPSYDTFDNYKNRGNQFKSSVQQFFQKAKA